VARVKAFYPRTLGKFVNTGVQEYGGGGADASVSYNYFRQGKETLIAFTAYFYPAGEKGETLEQAVQAATRDVKSANRRAKVTGSEPVQIKRDGARREGRRVTFEYTGSFGKRDKAQPLISELYVYPAAPGRWVKYQVTYPAAQAAELQGVANPFVASFPWPSGL
jgi:hypothetical protein